MDDAEIVEQRRQDTKGGKSLLGRDLEALLHYGGGEG